MSKQKSVFPPINVDGFATANNIETQEIAIHFESGDMKSILIFPAKMAKDLVAGLEKSLARLKQREQ